MSMLRVRINEGDDVQPNLLWDTVWHPQEGMADWAIADADEPQNRGGLRAKAALHSTVILALFTDRRMPDDHPLRKYVDGDDMRGWFGDAVDVRADLFEAEMGSLLWVFERAPLTDEIRKWVEMLATEALQPLIRQGAAVRIDAQAVAQFAAGRVDLTIQIYGRDGLQSYNHRFDDIWQQSLTSPPLLSFTPYPIENPGTAGALDFSLPANSGLLPLV